MEITPDLTPETLKDSLRSVTDSVEDLSELPLRYAEFVRTDLKVFDKEVRSNAINVIRKWIDYVRIHDVESDDLFMLRHHIASFAGEVFQSTDDRVTLESVDLNEVRYKGVTYEELLSEFVDIELLHDENVAVIGGVARLALKMHAGVDVSAELPINDVDVVIKSDADISSKADSYGFDVTGAKVINGSIEDILPGYITQFDCSMNQVAIYDGKLLFTPQSLIDIKDGNIRLTTRKDALFGSDAVDMEDGNIYLLKSGFYRGLSFLFRGKGSRLIVSQENIDKEKFNIGRYWLVMLYVKILPMGNEKAKKQAVGHWHDVARRIGSTETENPEQFLQELAEKYPMMSNFSNRSEGSYDHHAQTRWIIGKLANRVVESMFEGVAPTLPETYTPADIVLSDTISDFDLESFINRTRTVFDVVNG